MDNKIDIFFIILFIIVVSIIIGLNIVVLIDKKIGNVSVNIPKITVSPPEIILNINKDLQGNINICGKLNKTEHDKNLNTSNSRTNNNIEKFIVSDAQDFHNYDELRKKSVKMNNDFTKEKVDNPLQTDTVDYNTDLKGLDFNMQIVHPDHLNSVGSYAQPNTEKKPRKSFVSATDFGLDPPRQVVSCANSSISQKWKSGKNSLLPFQVACGQPNKIQAEDYYKTHYKKQIIPLEDSLVRGHNYMDYSNTISPHKIDFRILSQTTKGLNPKDNNFKNIPDGANYAFHNTPMVRMP
jgi:hypothetical protein